MQLKKAEYIISAAMMTKIMETLSSYHFGSVDDGDGYAIEFNNDDVIELSAELQTEIMKQEK